MKRFQLILAAVLLGTGPAIADQVGPILSAELFDQCALNAGGDPVAYSEMEAECQQVFAPCHVQLGQQDPRITPDSVFEIEAVTAMEQCLSQESEAILALLNESHGERVQLQTGEGAVPASWLVALPYQTSARAGAVCGRNYDGGSMLGYFQCLNDAWIEEVNLTRGLVAEMVE